MADAPSLAALALFTRDRLTALAGRRSDQGGDDLVTRPERGGQHG